MTFDTDEHVRRDVTLDSLAKLRPVFVKDGTVTAAKFFGDKRCGRRRWC